MTEQELQNFYLQPTKNGYPQDWKQRLGELYDKLVNHLSKDDKFRAIDFCDVSAGGIQIRLFCKQVSMYSLGDQFTLEYDFSNYDNAFEQVVENWKEASTDQSISSFQSFIADGEKYGWD